MFTGEFFPSFLHWNDDYGDGIYHLRMVSHYVNKATNFLIYIVADFISIV